MKTMLCSAKAAKTEIARLTTYQKNAALHAMAEAGTVWVPTLSTVGNLRGKGRFSEPDVQQILECALHNVAAFGAMGGLLAIGSDAGAWAVPHGYQQEAVLLAQALGPDSTHLLEKGNKAIMDKF